MLFNLTSSYTPTGDQPQAIQTLTDNLSKNINKQVLLGVTGSGKTFTIANVIKNTQLPTLIISHNKTLAGQLYQEFKELFPENKVSYFVSYYDYYQPEAYLPSSDTYIQKEVQINDLIDKLRLQSTSNLFSGKDNITVASVSCIYNIGDPTQFGAKTLEFKINEIYDLRSTIYNLVSLYYQRNETELKRSTFRVRGENIDIWPSYSDEILSLTIENNVLKEIEMRHPFQNTKKQFDKYLLYPAKQYVASNNNLDEIIKNIKQDKEKQVKFFQSQNKILEAHRIDQRVDYDMEMLKEVGYINGIENYSIYFEENRKSGQPPYTLIDYYNHLYGKNWLCVIDESHVTIPQINGMYGGDKARKQNLIDFGFRLPSAADNRPLQFQEFYDRIPNAIYVSATPAEWEIKDSIKFHSKVLSPYQGEKLLSFAKERGVLIQQIIRPTGLIDPTISIRKEEGQIPDLVKEIQKRVAKKERTLVITITKKMSEELTDYLSKDFKVAYLHSDIETLERTDILDKLRRGDFDVLVGINLLREGLDLPEVSLVAILDAGVQGFLRSHSSLIQIMGRASRHINGEVILYTDRISPAIQSAVSEVKRRREIQIAYNKEHNITPLSIQKSIRAEIIHKPDETIKNPVLNIDPNSLTPMEKKKTITQLKKLMHTYANDLDFEQAILIRDKIKQF